MEKQDRKLKQRQHRRETLAQLARQEDHFLDECITVSEDERTVMAKADTTNGKRLNIDKAHDKSNARPTPGIKQQWRNTLYGVCSALKRTATRLLTKTKQVTFSAPSIIQATRQANAVHLTYDSVADDNYVIEKD
jgi:putative cell wall-binding protein